MLLINTESFDTIDSGDGTSPRELRFGSSAAEKLFFDVSGARFVFTRDLLIQGSITATGSVVGVLGLASSGTLSVSGTGSFTSRKPGQVPLRITADPAQAANLTEWLNSAGTVRALVSPNTVLSGGDAYYFALKPGSREYRIGTYNAGGDMYFARSDSSNALVFTPNSDSVVLRPTTGVLHLKGQATNGLVLTPFEGGGLGVLQVGRRLSDSSPAVGASMEIWTYSGQSTSPLKIQSPGGSSTLAEVTPAGAVRVHNTGALALTVRGTSSGSVLHAEKTVSSSGTLIFEGAASGSSLYLGTSLKGAGLADCDNGSTSKLLWDTTTGRFSCGTDQASAGATLHMARMKKNATQSMPNGVIQKIYFDAEDFDVGSIANVTPGASGSGRVVIQQAGKYLMTGSWASQLAGSYHLCIYIRTNYGVISQHCNSTTISGGKTVVLSDVYAFSAGDWVELLGYQNSGGAVTTYGSGNPELQPRLSVVQVGP